MASGHIDKCCVVGTLHEGETTGKDIKIEGNIDAYLATPPAGKARDGQGILFIPDVIGIWQNSKLLADNFAAQGYTVLLPDIFNGDALKLNRTGDFDFVAWIAKGSTGDNPHTPPAVDPIILNAIKALKDLGIKRIGAVGYCFGAKYVVRHYKDGIDVGYVAHPTMVEEDELAAITGPLSIAAAQTDSIFPAEKRHKSEEILIKTGQPFQINLYSHVVHGFAVRCDTSVKIEKWSKEQAFFQAVTWFAEHL
ncbi:esterase/lipase [Trichoderma harzianum]|uniref:Esterase/lipase n=1 Tax=Trichoderma harzianum TaxID=5544 RepID=A0A0F9XID9_TRIHA|nr:esterase/lipase [Trichoderma harzianum]